MTDRQEDIDHARRHDITIDEVRSCPIFAHLTDQEAEEVVETIRRFSAIVYQYYNRQKEKKKL